MDHPLPAFRFVVAQLHSIGIVHPSCGNLNRYISQGWGLLLFISTAIFVLQKLVSIFVSTDYSDRATHIRDADTMGCLLVIYYQIYRHSANLFRLMSDLSETEDKETAAAVTATSVRTTKLSKLLTVDLIVLATLIMVSPIGGSDPVFEGGDGIWKITHGMPMAVWYPVEVSSYSVHVVLYILQALPIITEGSFYAMFFCTFPTIGFQVSARFRVLSNDMRRCKGREIMACIQKHQLALRLVRDLNRVTRSFMGWYVIGIVICMGTTSLEIITVDLGSPRQLAAILFLISQVGSVLLCCGFGEVVTAAGDKFFEATLFSPWTEMDMEYRKLMITLSGQAARPVTITGGAIYNLSFRLYAEMMKTWYQMFNILKKLM